MAKEITRDAKFRLLGEDKSFGKTIDGAHGKASQFSGFMKGWGGKVAGSLTAAFAVSKIVDFGQSMLEQGNQLENWRIKSKTVFGDQLGEVQKWADANNEAMGLTDEQLVGLAASTGDLLKPLGIVGEELSTMSTEMIGLSGSLSAWSGGTRTAAEVAHALQSAMLGETEQLKELGISISAAEVAAKAMSAGLVETEVDMTKVNGATLKLNKAQQKLVEVQKEHGMGSAQEAEELQKVAEAEARLAILTAGTTATISGQAKAQATQMLIMEKSTDAQTAWADGSMDNIKAQNELKAAFAEAKEELASQLLPVFQKAIRFLASDVLPFVKRVTDAFSSGGLSGAFSVLGDAIADAWPTIRATLARMAEAFFEWVRTDVPKAIADAWPDVRDGLLVMGQAMVDWIAEEGGPLLGKAWAAMADWIEEALPPMLEKLLVLIEDATDWMLETGLPSMASWLKKEGPGLLSAWVEDVIIPITINLGKVVAAFLKWSVTKMTPKIVSAGKKFAENLVEWLITDAIPSLGSKLLAFSNELLAQSRRWIGDRLSTMGREARNTIVGWFSGLGNRIRIATIGIFDGIWSAFKAPLNRVIEAWNNKIGGKKLPDILGGFTIPTVTFTTPNIKPLHDGGIFQTPIGRREGLALLEGGEQVLPRTDVPQLAAIADQLTATIADFKRNDARATIIRDGTRTSVINAPVTRTQTIEQHLHFNGPVSRDSVQWIAQQVRTAQRRGDLRSA
jgi:hypothetical protein